MWGDMFSPFQTTPFVGMMQINAACWPAQVSPVSLFIIPFLLTPLHKACKCGTNGSWGELVPQQDVEEVHPLFAHHLSFPHPGLLLSMDRTKHHM